MFVADWLFLASPWLPDGARYEQQRPITLAVREAASKQFCCSPHFRGGKIHLHSRGLTLLARGSIGSSVTRNLHNVLCPEMIVHISALLIQLKYTKLLPESSFNIIS